MGMYTEFHYNVELIKDVPEDVVNLLKYMVGDLETYKTSMKLLDPLFQCGRWEFMLRSDSYYFPSDTHSTIRFDDIAGSYYLCIRCNLKNYCNEIQKFIEWIKPYVCSIKGEFLGFYRYEEAQEPTLIYY